MNSIRIHGNAPYSVALAHGGPGAAGEMAPVAAALSRHAGILELHQTKYSIDELVAEMKDQLVASGHPPVTVIGHSWGAWLGFLFAARHPGLVRKLILVGSGPFEEAYAQEIMSTRMTRLSAEERAEWNSIMSKLGAGEALPDLTRLDELMSKADTYEPLEDAPKAEPIAVNAEQHGRIWAEASALRRSGQLLEHGKRIACPVVAIHGEHDPHPYQGVFAPLTEVLNGVTCILLPRCGHTPWMERHASHAFYDILGGQIND
ncbi:MAG: alpha/beta hydrolase [Paenibacillus dendritiformis]|uniref:alpha/beta fold hydrolase n=1 Tax=uncultured Paenibacillus sp. TaxID=227322 RepID=UPI0025EC29AB|nr:alpha/beta hydrolase [uncultured Paenibacillus sp.]MDU5144539.1 alpha/beta hydrolase [Paenibacillus dendritiformis]